MVWTQDQAGVRWEIPGEAMVAQTSNGSRAGVEKWSGLGCILKAEPTGFPGIGCGVRERERGGGEDASWNRVAGSPAGHPRGGC